MYNLERLTMATLPNDPRRLQNINDDYFYNINSEDKAYFLGLLLADGSMHKNRNRFSIALHVQDKEILDIFAQKLNAKVVSYKSRPEMCALIITSKQLKESLLKLEMIPNKVKVLKFPETIPENLYSHFIRGYFDGDGSVNQYNVYLSSSSKVFLEKIKLILDKKGINSYFYLQKDTQVNYLKFKSKESRKNFLNFIYADCQYFIDRKYQKAIVTHQIAPLEGKPLKQIAEKTVNPEIDLNFCKKCNQTKLYKYFVKKKGMLFGYANVCKACQNLYQKKFKLGTRPEVVV